jgi:hypothetical protein
MGKTPSKPLIYIYIYIYIYDVDVVLKHTTLDLNYKLVFSFVIGKF